jgi:hypothetical protein
VPCSVQLLSLAPAGDAAQQLAAVGLHCSCGERHDSMMNARVDVSRLKQ